MENATLKSITKGLVISLAYGVAYLVLRQLSFNQWFLPAGLRCGVLLLAPYRYWPWILAGDVIALLYLRIPMADQFGELWAYLSPFLLIAIICIPVRLWRSLLGTTCDLQRWVPLVALTLAAWSAASNMMLNYSLHGPRPFVSVKNYVNYLVGDFFGILLFLLACLLWLHRRDAVPASRWFRWHCCGAIAVTVALYFAVSVPDVMEESIRLLLLMLMIVPAVHLTFTGGWRGAAIGVLLANIAIAQPLASFAIPNQADAILLAQEALAIAACGLLFLGYVISDHYQAGLRAGMAEKQALRIARTSFLSSERMLREQLLYMAQMQLMLDGERRELAEWLKSHGRFDAAMQLNSSAVQQRQLFEGQAMALYPIRIEQGGLFRAVHEKAFSDFWAGDAEVVYGFRGPIGALSVDLQLVAYRCICHAMALLSDYNPEEYRLNMRAWRGSEKSGVFVRLQVVPAGAHEPSNAGRTAETFLMARVEAHGGRLRRSESGVSFLLAETPALDTR